MALSSSLNPYRPGALGLVAREVLHEHTARAASLLEQVAFHPRKVADEGPPLGLRQRLPVSEFDADLRRPQKLLVCEQSSPGSASTSAAIRGSAVRNTALPSAYRSALNSAAP